MKTEDWMRAVLGAVTVTVILYIVIAHEGRLPDDAQFCAVVIALLVVVLLAADDCRAVTPIWESLRALEPFEALDAQVSSLQSLPWTVYNAITPGLERLTSLVRGDAGYPDVPTTELNEQLYAGEKDAATLHKADGKVDEELFMAMKVGYKQLVVLLCRMKSLSPASHDALVTAIGACD